MELSESAPVLNPEVVEFVHSGVAVGVATRDESKRPAFTRAWGPEVSADHRSLTVCVSAAEGSATRANLAQTGRSRSGSARGDAKAVQLKGVAVVLGEPGPDDLAAGGAACRCFSGRVRRIGVPPEVANRMFVGSTLVLISVSIVEGFDPTPGPTAGRRL